MRIGVCIKQVPAGNARMDSETGVLIRSSAGGTINPYDLFALEAALQAAAALQITAAAGAAGTADDAGELFVITMGPPRAEEALREALAMGAAPAILLSDPAFSGADVAATSRTLAEGLRKHGVPDLLFCGQQTTDGDTAQLPFALAARLGIPALGWVKGIEYFRKEGYSVLQELSGGTVRVRGDYPALFAVSREAVHPRAPSLPRRLAARKLPVTVWGLADLPDRDPRHHGLAGSPTRVRKLYPPVQNVKTPPLRVEAAEAVSLIQKALAEW
ncbi:MAG: electron transfer flavoprotein subunit beta/FixA family protein [Treponema sp.]|jgi:electron transfer flavoprotein beta subunit|nr:electron transfer flavoprotein subunit beta/FixA family protein [Treponema sp.]